MPPFTATGWLSESCGTLQASQVSLRALLRLRNNQRGEPPRRGRGAAGPRGAGGPQAPPLGGLFAPLWGALNDASALGEKLCTALAMIKKGLKED